MATARKSENPLLTAALEYLDRGWSVIPIWAGEKRPSVRTWKKYQTKQPTESQVRKWFGSGDKSIESFNVNSYIWVLGHIDLNDWLFYLDS